MTTNHEKSEDNGSDGEIQTISKDINALDHEASSDGTLILNLSFNQPHIYSNADEIADSPLLRPQRRHCRRLNVVNERKDRIE